MEKDDFEKYWSMPLSDVIKYLNSNSEGLTSEEALLRVKTNGENILNKEKKISQIMMFVEQFKNPIIIILIVATAISTATGDWVDALIIFLIIFVSAILSFLQEYSASNAIEELRAKVQVKSVVIRDGKPEEIPSSKLVSGDIIKVSSGSLIPADGLILECNDFFVNQSILTGESLPNEKKPGVVSEDVIIEERTNCVYMGTNVHNGSATILIVEIGENTEFGQIANHLSLRPPETEFERGVRHFGSKDNLILGEIQNLYADWSSKGIRVLGIAQKFVEIKDDYVC